MKQVNKLLKAADAALSHTGIVKKQEEVEDVNKGYISGFGPAVISSGLVPAMAFYISDSKKKVIIDAIAETLNLQDEGKLLDTGKSLFRHCISQMSDKKRLFDLREKIITASVALKLVMRTYTFVESKNAD